MEPQIKLALLCDYALRSQDGKLGVLGIFSQINLQDIPGASPPFFVVISVILDQGTHPVQFGLIDPMGQQVLPEPPSFDVEVEVPGGDADLLIQFNGLPLQRAGIYQVQLLINGRLIHSIPLNVQSLSGSGMPPFRA